MDTGSSCTHVAPAVLDRLGLEPVGRRPCYDLEGGVKKWFNLFSVSLLLPADGGDFMGTDELPVLDFSLEFYDVILGRDVLKCCRLFYDGPRGFWVLQPVRTLSDEDRERIPPPDIQPTRPALARVP